jgi:glycosyltransferase involved in cell wall biosynthesis
MMGRADKPTITLKGIDIAVKAMSLCQIESPRVVVRGTPKGTSEATASEDLYIYSSSPTLTVTAKAYSEKMETISNDLESSSLVLMPSREEGFGLVGWEAIQAGIPVLVSDKSGLGELLKKERFHSNIVAVSTAIAVLEEDAKKWSLKITTNLTQRQKTFEEAHALRKHLYSKYSWEKVLQEWVGEVQILFKI